MATALTRRVWRALRRRWRRWRRGLSPRAQHPRSTLPAAKRFRRVLWRSFVGTAMGLTVLFLLAELSFRAYLWLEHRPSSGAGARFDLYGLGGSTMAGEPFHELFSVTSLVSHVLGDEVGGREIEVRSLARRGSSIYPQVVAFRKAVYGREASRPGAVLIYSGHNERFEGPVTSAASFFSWLETSVSPHSLVVTELLYRVRLVVSQRHRTELWYYEACLRALVDDARAAGLIPILATVASNVSGVPPFHFDDDGEDLNALVDDLEGRLDGEDLTRRLRAMAAKRLDAASQAAFLEWRLARHLDKAGRRAEARALYERAHAWSAAVYYRCATDAQNDVVRKVARELNCPLFDTVRAMERVSEDGIVGWNLFADGHHPNLDGYALLASGLARQLARHLDTQEKHSLPDGHAVAVACGGTPEEWAAAHFTAVAWLIGAMDALQGSALLAPPTLQRLERARTLLPTNARLAMARAVVEALSVAHLAEMDLSPEELGGVLTTPLAAPPDVSSPPLDELLLHVAPFASPESVSRARQAIAAARER